MFNQALSSFKFVTKVGALLGLWFLCVTYAQAASLSISPSTGVYTSNTTFTVSVNVNTGGQPVNAADGVISFNPNELSVVSVNRSGSIFNLWVAEPTFSNSAGTINFSGGLPSGYTGSAGRIMTVTFRTKGSGSSRVSFQTGSVLANDGRGTNILTSMNSANYTIQATAVAPEPEVIEYIAAANTPSRPIIKSDTHPIDEWSNKTEAVLSWSLPPDVTSVRTLLNDNPTSVPTKVYDTPISEITLSDLEDGITYLHLQFRNAEGWGRVNHYPLRVDTKAPTSIHISHDENADLSNPTQVLRVVTEDETTDVNRYKVVIDGQDPFEYIDETGSSTVVIEGLEPGFKSVIIEAFDQAGNSIVGTYTFTVVSFDKPVFTDVPTEINPQVIPVIKGNTKPNSAVEITLTRLGSEATTYTVNSDQNGQFVFIPEGTFVNGVYEIYAIATDQNGAQSEMSDIARIAVQETGFIRIGSFIVSILSVIIPLIVLLGVAIIAFWYLVLYSRKFRKRVRVESTEAMEILRREFADLQTTLRDQESAMQASRKTKKLTKAESEMVEVLDKALQSSQKKVEKEITDITELSRKNNN
tara:strand:- start:8292 stop:10043 length:1752 start_codon:yes stop_codon:yes gene_type:complete